jgi:hypothetical protein
VKYEKEMEHVLLELSRILEEHDPKARVRMVFNLTDKTIGEMSGVMGTLKHPDPVVDAFAELNAEIFDELEWYAPFDVQNDECGTYYGDDKLENLVSGYIDRLTKLLKGEIA